MIKGDIRRRGGESEPSGAAGDDGDFSLEGEERGKVVYLGVVHFEFKYSVMKCKMDEMIEKRRNRFGFLNREVSP
jgi:hypothetical protein